MVVDGFKFGWWVGLPINWFLVGGLVGRSVGCLVGCLAGGLVLWLVVWLVCWLVGRKMQAILFLTAFGNAHKKST